MKRLLLFFAILSMSFLSFQTPAQSPVVKEWNFSFIPWNTARTYYTPVLQDDLMVMADSMRTVSSDLDYKNAGPLYFKFRLKLGGIPLMSPVMPHQPTTNAVAFKVAGPGYFHFVALSDTSETNVVHVTDGNLINSQITVPKTYNDLGSTAPMFSDYWGGDATTLYLYSPTGKVNLYYLKVDNPDIPQDTIPVDTVKLDTLVFNVMVPPQTKRCHLVGSFNGWDVWNSPLMNMVDSTHYTYTLYNVKKDSLEYKYVSGQDWGYVEKGPLGEEISNRMYHPNDTVATWLNIYNPDNPPTGKMVTIEVAVPAMVKTMHLVGNYSNWMFNDTTAMMLKDSSEIWNTFTKTFYAKDANNLMYKFSTGPDWGYSQTQDNDFKFPDPASDYAFHRVFGFWQYYNMETWSKDWNFSKYPFGYNEPYFMANTDADGLEIGANSLNPVYVKQSLKRDDQLQFSHRLVLNALQHDTVFDKYSGYVGFKVNGPCQIALGALANDTLSASSVILTSDGNDSIYSFVAPAPWQDEVMIDAFNYTGGPTNMYIYTNAPMGVGLYYLGVNNYGGSTFEEPKLELKVEVPAGTQQVMVAGDFNNWDPTSHYMYRVDSTHFSMTLWNVSDSVQYKYLNGPDWAFREVAADGSEVGNRYWSPMDKVAAWANVFEDKYTTIYSDNYRTGSNEYLTVAIKSKTNEPREVISYQFTYYFDEYLLKYQGFDLTGTVSQNGQAIVNHASWGILYVSFMSENPIQLNGDLIKFKFRTESWGTNYPWINDFYFNADHVWDTYNLGEIVVERAMKGDVDGNQMIQAYDAALTLQYSVGKDPLPMIDPLPWDFWRLKSANVDAVEGITANDAALILQYSARLIDTFDPVYDSTMMKSPILDNTDVKIEVGNNLLIFRSYGNMIGFNLNALTNKELLGTPVISPAVSLSAVNTENGMYAVGLANLESLPDGTEIMRIPINDGYVSDILFNFIVNTGEKEVLASISTDLKNGLQNNIQVYPNPATDQITLNNLQDGSRIMIFDITGKMIYSGISASDTERITLNGWSAGIYTINIVNDEVNSMTKFIKK